MYDISNIDCMSSKWQSYLRDPSSVTLVLLSRKVIFIVLLIMEITIVIKIKNYLLYLDFYFPNFKTLCSIVFIRICL